MIAQEINCDFTLLLHKFYKANVLLLIMLKLIRVNLIISKLIPINLNISLLIEYVSQHIRGEKNEH